MKIYNTLFLLLLVTTIFSCKDDDTITEPEANNGPFESIQVGSTENAFSQIVNDTLTATTQMDNQVNSEDKYYDLNDDGILDVGFTVIGGGSASSWGVTSYYLPLDSNETVLTSCQYTDLKSTSIPESYSTGTKISDELSFEPYTKGGAGIDLSFDGSSEAKMNCWGNNVYHYIAVKIKSIEGVEYAWIKLATNTSEHQTQIFIESFGSRK